MNRYGLILKKNEIRSIYEMKREEMILYYYIYYMTIRSLYIHIKYFLWQRAKSSHSN